MLTVLGLLALGALLVFVMDIVDVGIERVVRRFKPITRTYQHYPGGPYLQATSDAPSPFGF